VFEYRHLVEGGSAHPRKLGPALCPYRASDVSRSAKEHPVIIFFETLLVLVAVGVLAFAGLTVKKLYQGQR
jgi:hypothetical protein